jgi:hypothetical protein
MFERPTLIGIVDSGLDPLTPWAAARCFRVEAGRIIEADATADAIGHATNTIQVIRAGAPWTRLAIAQVFFDSMSTTPDTVAAAIDWLSGLGAAIVNLSLGTTADSPALRERCRRALENGSILIASVPARGPLVFPAAYEGIWRVSGDVRCAPGEFSLVGSARVDFGACPRALHSHSAAAGGASIAAARVTAALGALLEAGRGPDEAVAEFRAGCTIIGPQCKPIR